MKRKIKIKDISKLVIKRSGDIDVYGNEKIFTVGATNEGNFHLYMLAIREELNVEYK